MIIWRRSPEKIIHCILSHQYVEDSLDFITVCWLWLQWPPLATPMIKLLNDWKSNDQTKTVSKSNYHSASIATRSRATWNAAISELSCIFSLVPDANRCLHINSTSKHALNNCSCNLSANFIKHIIRISIKILNHKLSHHSNHKYSTVHRQRTDDTTWYKSGIRVSCWSTHESYLLLKQSLLVSCVNAVLEISK